MMGGGRARRSSGGRERGADLRYNMEITLEEAFTGKTAQIRVPTSITCDECSGTGAKPVRSRPPVPCAPVPAACAQHRASSRWNAPAPPAMAAGRRSPIPAASATGEGEAGTRGGPSGDLYIFLSVKPHEFFQRDGADLYCKVPISMTTAALGGDFEVSTLDSTQTRVKVPKVHKTPSNSALKARSILRTPQNLSKRQRELLEEFEQLSSKENSPKSAGFFSRMKEFFEAVPMLNFPMPSRIQLMEIFCPEFHAGRPLIQITYGPRPPVPAGKGNYTVQHYDFVVRNVPPAQLWVYRSPLV
ncbi:chaperone protein DnaJ [Ditylenchus destructor]|nr:chaperone protein DnaJ [Ditylenchus destructor]